MLNKQIQWVGWGWGVSPYSCFDNCIRTVKCRLKKLSHKRNQTNRKRWQYFLSICFICWMIQLCQQLVDREICVYHMTLLALISYFYTWLTDIPTVDFHRDGAIYSYL